MFPHCVAIARGFLRTNASSAIRLRLLGRGRPLTFVEIFEARDPLQPGYTPTRGAATGASSLSGSIQDAPTPRLKFESTYQNA